MTFVDTYSPNRRKNTVNCFGYWLNYSTWIWIGQKQWRSLSGWISNTVFEILIYISIENYIIIFVENCKQTFLKIHLKTSCNHFLSSNRTWKSVLFWMRNGVPFLMRVGDSNLELMISSFTRLKILIQELLARMLPRKIESLNLRLSIWESTLTTRSFFFKIKIINPWKVC